MTCACYDPLCFKNTLMYILNVEIVCVVVGKWGGEWDMSDQMEMSSMIILRIWKRNSSRKCFFFKIRCLVCTVWTLCGGSGGDMSATMYVRLGHELFLDVNPTFSRKLPAIRLENQWSWKEVRSGSVSTVCVRKHMCLFLDCITWVCLN